MRRFAPVALGLLGALFVVGALHARNADAERANLERATERYAELAERADALRHRRAATDDIAGALCAGRATTSEAVEALAEHARTAPDWLAQLRGTYGLCDATPATDRALLVRYLRQKVEYQLHVAELEGDVTRAAAIAARLAQFDAE
jgi:hypothetical protein